MSVRWILGARNSMQRIGFLYFVCRLASRAKPITRDSLAGKLRAELKAPVPADWAIVGKYIDRLKVSGVNMRYGPHPSVVELQDSLLANERLPSATGAVTDEVAADIVDEAVAWGLLRNVNYTLTDRGAVMLHLWDLSETGHPLLLGPLARQACTYWYLDADGDALRAAYSEIPTNDFTRKQLGEAAGRGLQTLLSDKKFMNSVDRTARTRFRSLAEAILNPKGNASGSGRAVYQQATLRGEHPADLRLLEKPDRFSYSYVLPAKAFIRMIGPDVGSFLQHGFAREYSRAHYCEPRHSDPEKVWPFFVRAYDVLKNRLGYASYEDVALLAQTFAVVADEWFEVEEIKGEISSPKNAHRTRLGLGRSGKAEYVKVENV
jgi:hypothetical protein